MQTAKTPMEIKASIMGEESLVFKESSHTFYPLHLSDFPRIQSLPPDLLENGSGL